MTFKKTTKQRQLILDILSKSNLPLTAEQIYSDALNVNPNIAKTTIYRNIDLLLNTGEISRYRLADDRYSYMLNNSKHKHFIMCEKCGKIFPLNDCPIEELEKKICDDTDFVITNHSIELFGHCKKCVDETKK